MKILFVFGTRPEAIKLCPLVLKLRSVANVTVCVTGQHRELLDPFLTLFRITPEYDLMRNKVRNGSSNSRCTGNAYRDISDGS